MHLARPHFIFLCLGAWLTVSTLYGSHFVAVIADDTVASLTATTSHPAQLSGTLTRGSGLDAETLFSDYYDAAGWSESGGFPALATNEDYFEFSISVASGYTFTPTSLDFYYEEGGNLLGPSRISLRSSQDAYSSELFLDTNTFAGAVHSVDLSSSGVLSGTTAFRWYGYGAGDSDGILGFTNNAVIDAESTSASIKLSGDLSPIPERANFALFMGLVVVVLVKSRRCYLEAVEH